MAKIHLAFRFHINFYHSYRGDKPDETGFGKDMRIIKYILDVLDQQNANNVPVKGTWDSENYFSLEKLMPKYCPELIERLQERVNSGVDEMEIMSYNNGLVSAHTTEEFRLMMSNTLSNKRGSGLKDLFKEYAPIVRSQECMMTPALVPLYKEFGVEAITLFYSCIPFNGFSNFEPLLPMERRFNPMWYRPEGSDDKIIVIPAVGVADVFDNLGIRAYVKHLRKYQLSMEEPKDMLILVDMDADDDYWRGYLNTYLSEIFFKDKEKLLWKGGLNFMINQVKDLDYVEFDTPYNYLKNHPPVGEVNFTQDTADGSFDSLSPWSDKLDNAKLWSGIERARTLCEYARALSDDNETEKAIQEALEKRILTLSTTHFGLSTPVMCVPRLEVAAASVKDCIDHSKAILDKAQSKLNLEDNSIKAVFQTKYFVSDEKKGFIRMKVDEDKIKNNVSLFDGENEFPAFITKCSDGYELRAALKTNKKELNLTLKDTLNTEKHALVIEESSIANKDISLVADQNGSLTIFYKGAQYTEKGSMDFWIDYNNEIIRSKNAEIKTDYIGGNTAILTRKGELCVGENADHKIVFEQKFYLNEHLPYLYAEVEADYPKTENFKAKKHKVKNLKREWDSRWIQVAPFEIIPAIKGTDETPINVIKHNFFEKISSYKLNYGTFSKNEEIDSMNNAITAGWVAVANNEKGILLSQSVAEDNNFAFARMRVRKDNGGNKVMINPMGTYFGKQLHYPTRRHELVGKVALSQAAQYDPLAPSYSGGKQFFSLMIAPFEGKEPSIEIQNDAIMHSYPAHIISSYDGIKDLELEKWSMPIIK